MEPRGTASRHWAEQICRRAGFEPDVRLELADLQSPIRLVESGKAVALLPVHPGRTARQVAGSAAEASSGERPRAPPNGRHIRSRLTVRSLLRSAYSAAPCCLAR